jgi:hypothetical protein
MVLSTKEEISVSNFNGYPLIVKTIKRPLNDDLGPFII